MSGWPFVELILISVGLTVVGGLSGLGEEFISFVVEDAAKELTSTLARVEASAIVDAVVVVFELGLAALVAVIGGNAVELGVVVLVVVVEVTGV